MVSDPLQRNTELAMDCLHRSIHRGYSRSHVLTKAAAERETPPIWAALSYGRMSGFFQICKQRRTLGIIRVKARCQANRLTLECTIVWLDCGARRDSRDGITDAEAFILRILTHGTDGSREIASHRLSRLEYPVDVLYKEYQDTLTKDTKTTFQSVGLIATAFTLTRTSSSAHSGKACCLMATLPRSTTTRAVWFDGRDIVVVRGQ